MSSEQTPFTYSIADAAMLPLVSDILEEAAQWLTARGVNQWKPGSLSPHSVATWQTDGCSLLAWQGATAIGTVSVSYTAEDLWQAMPEEAGYIHKLAVRRAVAGHGVSVGLLRAAEAQIAAKGMPLARLDCWAGNTALRAFYTAAGYTLVGEVTEEYGGEAWQCALFQRRLTPRSPTPSPG